MTFIYWIIVAFSVLYSLVLLFAILDIRKYLKEIIESGDLPAVARKRARKEAERIIKMEYVENPKKIDELRQVLTKAEDISLLSQLMEIQRKQS